MIRNKMLFATFLAAPLMAGAPAVAAPILTQGGSITSDPGAAPGENVTIAFTATGTGNANAALTGGYALLSASQSGAAAPAGFNGYYLSVPDPNGTLPGLATINFSGDLMAATALSLIWGSVDTYNTFSITDSTGTYSLAGVGGGNQATSSRLTVTGINGLKSISFASTQRAFEADTIRLTVAAVPEAETWAMMVLGFGAIGFAARRRPVARRQGLPA